MAVRTSRAPSAVSALSEHLDTRFAARELASELRAGTAIRPDLLVVFGTFHHRALFSDAIDTLRSALHPAHVLACTAEGVIGDSTEVERTPGISAIALSLPNTVIRPFAFGLGDGPPPVWSEGFVRDRVSLPPDEGALEHRGVLMLADPFSIHAGQACAAIEQAAGPSGARIFGGIASGSTHPGLNVLCTDRRTASEGIVGLSIFGDVVIDSLVSQGCRPIGPTFVVTKSRGNELLELGGKSALGAVQEMAEALPPTEQGLLSQGLLVGIAYHAAKARLGRGDFLVRPVHAVHPHSGSLLLTDAVKPGTTIQFQIRDKATAHDDLDMLLSAEQLRDAPAAALVFSCNMRGTRMFAERDHDAALASAHLGAPPMAGFHAAGEIGPLGRRSFVHTQTASFALFRGVK